MKKSILFLALVLSLVFALTSGALAASTDLATEAQGKTLLIDKVKPDSIVGTGSFANEGAENLFDNNPETKFCTNVFPAEVTWQLDGAYVVDAVVICTANDNAKNVGRNPAIWVLSGSTDGTTSLKSMKAPQAISRMWTLHTTSSSSQTTPRISIINSKYPVPNPLM